MKTDLFFKIIIFSFFTSINSYGQQFNISQLENIFKLNIDKADEYLNSKGYFFDSQDERWNKLDCKNILFEYKGIKENERYSIVKNSCEDDENNNESYLSYAFTEISLFNTLMSEIRKSGYRKFRKNILENEYMVSYYNKGKFFITVKSGTLKSTNIRAMFFLRITQNSNTL